MKLNAAKIKECAAWVEQNGLYPQAGGAPIKQFCAAVGIDWKTYRKWMEKSDFSDAIKKAQEVFRTTTIDSVVNAMKKRALGYTEQLEDKFYKGQVIREYDPKTGKKVKEYLSNTAVLDRKTTRLVHHPPDVAAGVFLLTNMDPDNWKNRRNDTTDINASLEFEEPPQIVFYDNGADGKKEKEG